MEVLSFNQTAFACPHVLLPLHVLKYTTQTPLVIRCRNICGLVESLMVEHYFHAIRKN